MSKKIIICDIDGTIAKMHDRGPFDWKKVGQDTVNSAVLGILNRFKDDHTIILMSGRDKGACEKETRLWLLKNKVPFDELHMRPAGDNRKDSIVKRELFEKCITDASLIQFVLDDRNQVVEMWRNELGLICLQVAEGNF